MAEKEKEDYTLEEEKSSKKDEKIERERIPIYMEPVELNDDRKKVLSKEFFEELEAIQREREKIQLDQRLGKLSGLWLQSVQSGHRCPCFL